jgi:nicotinamidase-related amidase
MTLYAQVNNSQRLQQGWNPLATRDRLPVRAAGGRIMLMKREDSQLLVVDVQERLLPVMAEPETVVGNCAILMQSARELGIPMLVSEQYPKGLGPTIDALHSLAAPDEILPKITFSCADDDEIATTMRSARRRQVIVCGIEAHVCVLQTALGLQRDGYRVFVAGDATSSRRSENREAAHHRLAQAGIGMVSTEMVAFEWLHHAGTPEFKTISKLIK